jgi:drug/metabolite transporter (DMT)-like permease
VLVVLRPDGAALHSIGALVALGGAVMTACVSILLRQLGQTEAAATTVTWFTVSSVVPLAVLMLWFGQAHDPLTWALLLALGSFGGAGQLLLTSALRFAPVAVVLPVDYSGLIWATLLGWLLFGTLPLAATWIGAPIIIASGLIILWREHHLGKANRAAASETSAA